MRYHFTHRPHGGKAVHFQTTVKAAGGSWQNAERICQMCYAGFVAGKTKEEVLAYRDELYQQCLNGSVMPPTMAVVPGIVMGEPDVPVESGPFVGDPCIVVPDVAVEPELPEKPESPEEPGLPEDDAVSGIDGAVHPPGNGKRRRRDNAGGNLPLPDSEEGHVDASAVSDPLQPLQTGECAGQPRLVVIVLEALLALTQASPKGTTTVTLLEEKVLALVGEPELEYSYFEGCMDYLTKAQAVEYRRAGRGGLLRLGRGFDAVRRALLPRPAVPAISA